MMNLSSTTCLGARGGVWFRPPGPCALLRHVHGYSLVLIARHSIVSLYKSVGDESAIRMAGIVTDWKLLGSEVTVEADAVGVVVVVVGGASG